MSFLRANRFEDCWMADKRSKSGDLVPDAYRFPSGIKSLVDEIHSMGMKFGIYESAGYITCQHLPGSLGMIYKSRCSCQDTKNRMLNCSVHGV